MSSFVLIGGKANKEILTNKIEKSIALLSNKDNPKILYCPYASKDIDKSINKFHSLMTGINCEIIDLKIEDIKRFDELLNTADILYIGGGCCDDLVALFKKYELDKILIKYLDSDKIFAGSSAGAMLYCKVAMGDKYVYSDNFHNHNYKMVNCLGVLDINICPHYQHEDLIIYNDELRNYNLDAFGIEEDTALVIENNKYYVIKESGSNSLYYFNKNDRRMVPLYEGVVYEKASNFRS